MTVTYRNLNVMTISEGGVAVSIIWDECEHER